MADVTETKREHNCHEDPHIFASVDDNTVREDKSRRGDEVISVLVLESIEKDRKKVCPLSFNCSIYRVPNPQFKRKPEAYIPRMVSIGPFHCDKEHLKPMEAQKLRYLNDFLTRSQFQATLENYVNVITELEDKARQCYSEIIQESKEEFVKMMVIDGCFILELILKITNDDPDMIMNTPWMFYFIKYDMILLENQLPFFVLERLYELFTGNSNSNGLDTLIFSFFQILVPQSHSITPESYQFRCSEVVEPFSKAAVASTIRPHHLLHFVRDLFLQTSSGRWRPEDPGPIMSIHCAIELEEACVKFEKEVKKKTCLLDITFQNGVLEIPTITIQDGTESLLRNLIAFEQSSSVYKNYITDYALFMDDLINSATDVELLQKKGIIKNWLGEPKDVAALFNGLLKDVTTGRDYFYNVRHELEKYYETPWHKWKASLMQKYFNSPWASISLIAASILLFLTVIQTVCSILQVT
ncbi:UPF0481 protein At3g47200-like isoform X2 [Macadamia integrifolia]|uniref:UPF0481 protein At3g47200-like isoform X1 n=1 Tax=Macadamia integrifolia TaxID=60698 RepID=UPI001C4EE9B3|nr:UPF0481 protein At3g47200-like isoform X1 [Macadamia integrifolia]XP_042509711.1 UPF0481 protein At3g47200-like isoform X2 [Macadamia integrifolia]